MKRFFLVIIYFLCSLDLFASVEKYIDKANELELYNNIQWERLLHYKKNFFGRNKSIITNDTFFISNKGRVDKKNEMIETIKGFYSEDIRDTKEYQHPICRFPARFDFLNKYLKFENLPDVKCDRYNEFYNEVEPEGLTLIFPTTYVNNPASMFGHTLIRIDKENAIINNSNINSIIINYGADTQGEESGLIYAFKGVFGLYTGFFSAMPYYKMTNNYNNIENRDIWEFKLNYSKEEADFYTKHLWELIVANIDYYFFKENCAYLILESLNVIRPEVDLTESFDVSTAPIETIKVLKDNDFIIGKEYRPSLQKEILYLSKNLSNEEVRQIKDFINTDKTLNIDNIIVYQTTYKLLEYYKSKGNIELNKYRQKSLELLRYINDNTNSNINLEESGDKEEDNNILEIPTSPDEGHKIAKLGLSFGRYYKENYLQLHYKPSYHELIDDWGGYDKDSEINFFNTKLRFYFGNKLDKDRIQLDTFNFVQIKSLPRQNRIFKPLSFTVLFGINNLYDNYKVLLLDVNGGITLGNEYFSIFALLGPKANYSGHFEKNFNIGINGIIGGRIDTKYFKSIIEFKTHQLLDEYNNYKQLNIETNFILTKNSVLNIEFQRYFYRKYTNKTNYNIGFKILF